MNRLIYLLIFISLAHFSTNAQDKIVKTNGDTILAKVMELGPTTVSYKKANMPEGPTFTDQKSDIQLIIFSNGSKEYMSKSAEQNASGSQTATAGTGTAASQSEKNKIEIRDGNQYVINGRYERKKEVDKLLSKSKNPAILLPLKAAKATSMAQKIVKITSIPTTIGGGIGFLVSGVDLINDVRRGRDKTSTYVNFFSSIVATVSLPITNKILKNKSNKMYGKLIEMYNVTN